MAIACGIATIGAIVTGDIFNFTLFAAFIGVLNIGIVAAVKNKHVLSAAFSYGLVVMMGTVPLFAGAAIITATTGTLSIWELAAKGGVPVVARLLLLIGVLGEGMAPFYIGKAEITPPLAASSQIESVPVVAVIIAAPAKRTVLITTSP